MWNFLRRVVVENLFARLELNNLQAHILLKILYLVVGNSY